MNDMSLSSEDRVLVLGATGFIGRRLIQKLAEKKIRMRLLVRSISKASALVPKNTDAALSCRASSGHGDSTLGRHEDPAYY